VAVVGCGPSYDYEADAAAIEAIREAEEAAAVSGDFNAMGALFASDAISMPPNETAIVGADAIRAWAEGFMGAFTIGLDSYTTDDVKVDGDLAVEYYTGVWTLTPVEGGDATIETLKGLHVLERQADGSWKIVYDIFNSDDPLPEM
jgi:ketosteroid isomerase-like protein